MRSTLNFGSPGEHADRESLQGGAIVEAELLQLRQPGEHADREALQVCIFPEKQRLEIRQAIEDALRQAVYQGRVDAQLPQVRQAVEVAPLQLVDDYAVAVVGELRIGEPLDGQCSDGGQVRGGDVRAVADAPDRSQQHRAHAGRARTDAAAGADFRVILLDRQGQWGRLGDEIVAVVENPRLHPQLTVADEGNVVQRGDGDGPGAAGAARGDRQYVARVRRGKLVVVEPGGQRRLRQHAQAQLPRGQGTVEHRRHRGRTAVFRDRRPGRHQADDRPRFVVLNGQRYDAGKMNVPGEKPGRHVDFPAPGIALVIDRGDRHPAGAPGKPRGNGQHAVLADGEVEPRRPGQRMIAFGFGVRVYLEPDLAEARLPMLRPHLRDAAFADRGGRKVERHPTHREARRTADVHGQVRGLHEAVARVGARRMRQRTEVYAMAHKPFLVADGIASRYGDVTGYLASDVRHLDVERRPRGHVGGEAPRSERHDG